MEKISLERLHDILSYDPIIGLFTRKARARTCVSRVMGTENCRNGYRYIDIGGKKYLEHRLVWFYVHGVWPKCQIDHKNGQRTDNRIENLREATVPQNLVNSKIRSNSKSGLKGAHRNGIRWEARIGICGRTVRLGRFDNPLSAHLAYLEAARRYYGEFVREA